MPNEDVSSIVGKIMENPEFQNLVRELKHDQNSDSAEKNSSDDIMKKLPEVLSAVAPLMGSISGGGEEKKESLDEKRDKEDKKESSNEGANLFGGFGMKKYDKARAEKLLFALKPYLNRSRCEMIDRCVSVMQITDIMSAIEGVSGIKK